MNYLVSFFIFCLVLFLYLHIYYQLKTSNDLEVFTIQNPLWAVRLLAGDAGLSQDPCRALRPTGHVRLPSLEQPGGAAGGARLQERDQDLPGAERARSQDGARAAADALGVAAALGLGRRQERADGRAQVRQHITVDSRHITINSRHLTIHSRHITINSRHICTKEGIFAVT